MAHRIPCNFLTRVYEREHGKLPRGYGSWAFDIRPDGDCHPVNGNEPVWAPTSSYADAKKWIAAHARSLAPADFDGSIDIVVLS